MLHKYHNSMWYMFPEIHVWCDTSAGVYSQHSSQSLSPHACFSRGRMPDLNHRPAWQADALTTRQQWPGFAQSSFAQWLLIQKHMFKIYCSNCSVSNPSWCLNTQFDKGLQSTFFSYFFQNKAINGLKFLQKIMPLQAIDKNALILWIFRTQRCLTLLKTFKTHFYSLFTKIVSCDDE